MRVCFDTNALLRLFGNRASFPAVQGALLTGRLGIAVSTAVLLEYEEVVTGLSGPARWAKISTFLDRMHALYGTVSQVDPSFYFQVVAGPKMSHQLFMPISPCHQSQVHVLKKTLAQGLKGQLRRSGTTITSLATQMGTSRSAVRRILDEKNGSITLATLVAAAYAAGMTVHLQLESRIEKVEAIETPPGFEPLVAKMNAALDHIASFPRESERRIKSQPRVTSWTSPSRK